MDFEVIPEDDVPKARSSKYRELYSAIKRLPPGKAVKVVAEDRREALSIANNIKNRIRKDGLSESYDVVQRTNTVYITYKDE